jgi:hypothetical protein
MDIVKIVYAMGGIILLVLLIKNASGANSVVTNATTVLGKQIKALQGNG